MAFTRKSSPVQSITLSGQIPGPPKVPPAMTKRFPELEQYDKDLQEWWARFSDQLQRDRSTIQAQFDSVNTKLTALQSP